MSRIAGKISLQAALVAGVALLLLGAGIAIGSAPDSHDALIKLSASSGSRVGISSTCGNGKHAIGGGVEPRDSTLSRQMIANGPDQVSHAKATAWFGEMSAGDGSDEFRILAICSKNTDARVHTRNFAINDGGSKTLTCTRGTSAISGGVRYRDDNDAELTGLLRINGDGPLDASGKLSKTKDGDKPRKWRVTVGFPTGGHLDLKAYVVCSKRANARLETTAFTISNDSGFADRVKCPGSKLALGGGVVGPTSDSATVRASAPRGKSGTIINTGSGDRPKQWFATVYGLGVPKHRGGDSTYHYKLMAVCG